MSNEILGYRYHDSTVLIKKGDAVLFDGQMARIEDVCMPHTQLADSFCCEETGGLLIQLDNNVTTMIPFGHRHRITKLPPLHPNQL